MEPLQIRFNQHVHQHSFWSPASKLVVAVSGGVDSMVLLDLLRHLPPQSRPLLSVAHFNHQLREASEKEAQLVRHFCSKHNLPLVVKEWPVAAHPSTGIEEAARNARYEFLAEVLAQEEANAVVTAHHQGDQAETILMRLVRGSSLQGVTGIAPVREFSGKQLIRPLLPFSKTALYTYAKKQFLPYMEDLSNQDPAFARNRIRRNVMPELEKINLKTEAHLAEFAVELKESLAIVELTVSHAAEELVQLEKEAVVWSRSDFLNMESALQSPVLEKILNMRLQSVAFKRAQLKEIIHWLEAAGPNSDISLPENWLLSLRYDQCRLAQKNTQKTKQLSAPQTLDVGETISLPNGEMKLDAAKWPANLKKPEQWVVGFHTEEIALPLIIRHRLPGDRIKIKGTGTKKLKDLFIDQKIPAEKREEAIVVTDANGTVLWVPGFKESALSNKPETDTIQYILTYEKNHE